MGGQLSVLRPGYRVKILDGNAIAATEHLIRELRSHSAGPLPGKSLVVLDPQMRAVSSRSHSRRKLAVELRRAIGNRRSIRFLLPHRPVELHKIQRMLEAARLASHWGNVNTLRAIVIERDKAPQEVIDALPSPVGGYQIQLAPIVIVWYLETAATDQIGARLRELLDAGAIGYGANKREMLDKRLIPIMENVGEALKTPGMSEIDCGQGIAQALLVAVEQGLGSCFLGTADPVGGAWATLGSAAELVKGAGE